MHYGLTLKRACALGDKDMRYHYIVDESGKPEGYPIRNDSPISAITFCNVIENNSMVMTCTLYEANGFKLGIVQQKRDNLTGFSFHWGPIRSKKLAADIFVNNNFPKIFSEWAKKPDENGEFPITTVRKLMWALRMKPLPKERWETTFDRRFI